jgi:S-formylglutathione hydrolase FrmB
MQRVRQCALSAGLLLLLTALPGVCAEEGKIVRETIHGASLEKNPAGESADRWVSVYLPPSYEKVPKKRYPVLYLLHGIGDTDEMWMEKKEAYANIKDLMDRGIAEGRFGEMLVVMPHERTEWYGSFYVNSAWTGNWEDFTSGDLVRAIDGKYRTLARAASRGIAGHSMGGYGAITLGMKHPEVFSVVYGMNPALLGWGGDMCIENPAFASVQKMTTREQVLAGGVYPAAIVCVAQAFSPNPERPPFHVDFPFALVDGKLQPAEPAFSRWEANMPVHMVTRYRGNLQKLRGLRFDSGWDDEYSHIVLQSRELSRTLTSQGIEHIFEEYNGDHRNRLRGRTGRLYLAVLPYFGLLLDKDDPN